MEHKKAAFEDLQLLISRLASSEKRALGQFLSSHDPDADHMILYHHLAHGRYKRKVSSWTAKRFSATSQYTLALILKFLAFECNTTNAQLLALRESAIAKTAHTYLDQFAARANFDEQQHPTPLVQRLLEFEAIYTRNLSASGAFISNYPDQLLGTNYECFTAFLEHWQLRWEAVMAYQQVSTHLNELGVLSSTELNAFMDSIKPRLEALEATQHPDIAYIIQITHAKMHLLLGHEPKAAEQYLKSFEFLRALSNPNTLKSVPVYLIGAALVNYCNTTIDSSAQHWCIDWFAKVVIEKQLQFNDIREVSNACHSLLFAMRIVSGTYEKDAAWQSEMHRLEQSVGSNIRHFWSEEQYFNLELLLISTETNSQNYKSAVQYFQNKHDNLKSILSPSAMVIIYVYAACNYFYLKNEKGLELVLSYLEALNKPTHIQKVSHYIVLLQTYLRASPESKQAVTQQVKSEFPELAEEVLYYVRPLLECFETP